MVLPWQATDSTVSTALEVAKLVLTPPPPIVAGHGSHEGFGEGGAGNKGENQSEEALLRSAVAVETESDGE